MNLTEAIAYNYLVIVGVIILSKAVAPLNALLYYGKVAQAKGSKAPTPVQTFANVTVPKAWFLHFYYFFLALMWTLLFVCPHGVLAFTKYLVLWAVLTVQATRRAYESAYVTKWSAKSRMHFSHYLVGLDYYAGMVGICYVGLTGTEQKVGFSVVDIPLLVFFAAASVDQFQNHKHLALLVKYSTPSFRLFSLVSCAHYFDEVVIYLSVLSYLYAHAPVTYTDWAFALSYLFAVTNLSVSALETHHYYQAKFDDFQTKYAILPYVL